MKLLYNGYKFKGGKIKKRLLLKICAYFSSSITFLIQDIILLNNQYLYAKNNSKQIIIQKFKNFNYYDQDYLLLIKTLANLITDKRQDNVNDKISLEIESDKQIKVGDKFIAEGNVLSVSGSSKLIADKFVYDQIKRIFLIEGNIKFINGDQYFQASKLYFDVLKDEGYVEDIYGILDFENFSSDLKIDTVNNQKVSISEFENNEISNVNILRPSKLGFSKNRKDTDISLVQENIRKWRFKSKKIIFNSKSMASDEVFFTNDVFNKPQFILQNKDFSAEVKDNNMQFKSKNSFFIFENKLRIPVGPRNISTASNEENIWGLGYQYDDKDGWYLKQNLSPYKISENFKIDFDIYYIFNRAINGKTKSFRAKDSSPTDENVIEDSSLFDYFGADTKISGNLKKFEFDFVTEVSSLDSEKYDRSTRSKFKLFRTIDISKKVNDINSDSKIDNSLGTIFKERDNFFNLKEINDAKTIKLQRPSNRKLDLSLYATYREKINKAFSESSDLHTSYGTQLALRTNRNLNNRITENKLIAIDVGQYQAEKKDKKELEELTRLGLAGRIGYGINLLDFGDSESLTEEFKYIPQTINQGIDINLEVTGNLFEYSDGKNQEAITFVFGPKLTVGEFKRDYLDFARLQLNYVLVNGSDSSPFKFDNSGNAFNLALNYEQQLIGPILYGYRAEVNLKDNNKFSNGTYKIGITRRAYAFESYYVPGDKKIGFNFLINNFRYNGIPKGF